MDKRIAAINKILSNYSLGRFDKRLTLSPALDETDAVISGINMMGEELKTISISRDYFTRIFNSVSDMVMVVTFKGVIEDANRAAANLLGHEGDDLIGKNINMLCRDNPSLLRLLIQKLALTERVILDQYQLYSRHGNPLQVRITASRFSNEHKRRRILLTAADISLQVTTEKLIIRAIIDTQEKERQRLAMDLHDSLTQQLSAIKFYVSTLADLEGDEPQRQILTRSREALSEVIADMRNTCFNLMPRTLQEFGLVSAVKEFCSQFAIQYPVQFAISKNGHFPLLPAALSIDLYRVIQEFISNAIRHGNAGEIILTFRCRKKVLSIVMADDGTGFDINAASQGMGLQNMQSRVKSHYGSLQMESTLHRGTTCTIKIPLNPMQNDKYNSPGTKHRLIDRR